jgi:alkanesulfonate monooxygenase SsuD/methylene tetrahydromethanopterin reductase-like flavin-dependent oxidoreductase (luciferase family)
MRFGTMVPQGWKHDLADVANDQQWEHILKAAQTIDASGWDSLWVYDHFHTHPGVSPLPKPLRPNSSSEPSNR